MEQRLVVRLMGYWERIRKDKPIPDFNKNNPESISDLWQQCFVLSVVAGGEHVYKYEFMGDGLVNLYGKESVGKVFSLRDREFPNNVLATGLKEMFADGVAPAPKEKDGQAVGKAGKIVKYRLILLPFGKDNKVTHIVCGVSYREF